MVSNAALHGGQQTHFFNPWARELRLDGGQQINMWEQENSGWVANKLVSLTLSEQEKSD